MRTLFFETGVWLMSCEADCPRYGEKCLRSRPGDSMVLTESHRVRFGRLTGSWNVFIAIRGIESHLDLLQAMGPSVVALVSYDHFHDCRDDDTFDLKPLPNP